MEHQLSLSSYSSSSSSSAVAAELSSSRLSSIATLVPSLYSPKRQKTVDNNLTDYTKSLLLSLTPISVSSDSRVILTENSNEKPRMFHSLTKDEKNARKRLKYAERKNEVNSSSKIRYNLNKEEINEKQRIYRNNRRKSIEKQTIKEKVEKFWSLDNLERFVCSCCDAPHKKSKLLLLFNVYLFNILKNRFVLCYQVIYVKYL